MTGRLSALKGAQMVRVHDVKATKEILDMYYGICKEHWVVCCTCGILSQHECIQETQHLFSLLWYEKSGKLGRFFTATYASHPLHCPTGGDESSISAHAYL